MGWLDRFVYFLGSPQNALRPEFLVAAAAIACIAWFLSDRSVSPLRYLCPPAIYRHPSTKTDLKISVFNILFTGFGLLPAISLAPIFAYLFRFDGSSSSLSAGVAAAVLLVLGEDFARYVTHRFHHQSAVLWPFHAVHHSAEVLSPITYWRTHPLYFVVQRILMAAIVGGVVAVVIGVAFGAVPGWAYAASSLIFTAYFLTGAHLRHSHIWVSYGPALSRVLISPAQHQIHHSVELRHRDKNFGEIFALWDWLFGTLYVPVTRETFEVGLSDEEGRQLQQRYPSFTSAMTRPFGESAIAVHQWVKAKRTRAVDQSRIGTTPEF